MCNRCFGFGQILLQTSWNLTKSYKTKILSKPCQSRICRKGKTFLMRVFLFVVFNGRGFGNKCWCRLQERYFWDWKKVGCRIRHLKSATKKVAHRCSTIISCLPWDFAFLLLLDLSCICSWDWKTSEIDKWDVFHRRLQLKSSKLIFSWILGVGTRSLLQEAPNVWPKHYWK